MAAIRTHSLTGRAREASSAPASFRVELSDGLATTVHLAAYDVRNTEVRVVAFREMQPLLSWCRRTSVADALVGGFFMRDLGRPLGELRLAGMRRPSIHFSPPWSAVRACVHVAGGTLRIARRPDLPRAPRGDLLQAGPLLVEDGRPIAVDGVDAEGFSAGRDQFDSDITAGRHPRAALAIADGVALSVTCDGRSAHDAGMTLGELAELLAALGARAAVNLDGGGSATQVCGMRIVNSPREQAGDEIPGGRPVCTAVTFTPRAVAL